MIEACALEILFSSVPTFALLVLVPMFDSMLHVALLVDMIPHVVKLTKGPLVESNNFIIVM